MNNPLAVPGFPGANTQRSTFIGSFSRSASIGAFTGYNYQINPYFIAGIELEVQRLNHTSYASQGATTVDFLQTSKWTGNLSGRLGLLVSPQTLLYAKAGPGFLSIEGFEGFGNKFSRYQAAFHAGIGIETRVSDHLAIRFEDSFTGLGQSVALNSGTYNYRPSVIQSKVGLVWTPWGSGISAPRADAPVPLWTGFHVGGLASLTNHYIQVSDSVPNAALFGNIPLASTSFGGTVLAGADVQLPIPIVLGIEGSVQLQHTSFINPVGVGGIGQTYYDFASVDGIAAATARIGWLATADTQLFVKTGPAWMNAATRSDFWNSVAPNSHVGHHVMRGWQVGTGIETFVLPNVTARIEGTYTKSMHGFIQNGTNGADEFVIRPSNYTISSGIVYHF